MPLNSHKHLSWSGSVYAMEQSVQLYPCRFQRFFQESSSEDKLGMSSSTFASPPDELVLHHVSSQFYQEQLKTKRRCMYKYSNVGSIVALSVCVDIAKQNIRSAMATHAASRLLPSIMPVNADSNSSVSSSVSVFGSVPASANAIQFVKASDKGVSSCKRICKFLIVSLCKFPNSKSKGEDNKLLSVPFQ
ncbi:predicted protein [Chaetoceros tenuissimus]|uniref:Uncharacterized protein n=1 Tax=Chaetoceros tenuissimus TaxID=426638 RepID=A0AAD3HAZ9_9STRA|nr:predicted protein [Chaetoceros tenuissimus]